MMKLKNCVLLLLATPLLIGVASSADVASDPNQAPSSADASSQFSYDGKPSPDKGSIIVVSKELRDELVKRTGCWVRMYNRTLFEGNNEVTIVGPMNLDSMRMPGGLVWKRKAESLIAGPQATVIVYENESFKGASKTFAPGQKVENLRRSMRIQHSIDSLKISCPEK